MCSEQTRAFSQGISAGKEPLREALSSRPAGSSQSHAPRRDKHAAVPRTQRRSRFLVLNYFSFSTGIIYNEIWEKQFTPKQTAWNILIVFKRLLHPQKTSPRWWRTDVAVIALSAVPEKTPPLRCSALRKGWDEFTRERVDQLQGPFLSLFWVWRWLLVLVLNHHPSWSGTSSTGLAQPGLWLPKNVLGVGNKPALGPWLPPSCRELDVAAAVLPSGAGSAQRGVRPAPAPAPAPGIWCFPK